MADIKNAPVNDDVVTLSVVTMDESNNNRVRLTNNNLTKLGLITGQEVVVEGNNSKITADVWQSRGNANMKTVALTREQQDKLGISEGDTVTLYDSNKYSGSVQASSDTATNQTQQSPTPSNQTGQEADTEETYEASVDPDVSYDDIGGLDEELSQIRESIELPLSNPEVFEDLGIDQPKGVLMHGPPGTGKTLIAKAIANHTDAKFIDIDGPEIMSKYKGESEAKMRDIFAEAEEVDKAIIFFDEIDSLAGKRDDSSDVENRLVGQLLSLMDGVDSGSNVLVIGATNRVDSLDPALRRGGRFEREVEIGVPDKQGRKEILDIHTSKMPLDEGVTVDNIAERTHGFVGADLAALTREAAMEALRRIDMDTNIDELSDTDKKIKSEDFDKAMGSVEPSAMREFVAESPTTTFDSVGGLETVKEQLHRNVEWPLKYPDLFDATETAPSSGVMLHGDAGTGKTLTARALAGETGVNFIHVAGPELIDKYVGESEKAVRELFQRARQAAPTIIFFDDIDSTAGQYDTNDVTGRVVSQIEQEMDTLKENPQVTVVAATNDIERVDEKLLGPGRFEERIEFTKPNYDERIDIFNVHIGNKPLSDDVPIEKYASELEDVTGSDIESIVRVASIEAIEDAVDAHGIDDANNHADDIEITPEHFDTAFNRLGYNIDGTVTEDN